MTTATAVHARSCPGTCRGSRAGIPEWGHVGGHMCKCPGGGMRVTGCAWSHGHLHVGVRRWRCKVPGTAPSSSRLWFPISSATFCWYSRCALRMLSRSSRCRTTGGAGIPNRSRIPFLMASSWSLSSSHVWGLSSTPVRSSRSWRQVSMAPMSRRALGIAPAAGGPGAGGGGGFICKTSCARAGRAAPSDAARGMNEVDQT